jgi:signal peptidase I
MEIVTAPRRPTPSPWGRLAILVCVFAPVTLLALLPVGLGLHRYVVSGDNMAGTYGRGTVVFERVVPVSDLRVGDVITFPLRASAEADGMVTSRIVSIEADAIRTQGDARATPDPWVLPGDPPTRAKVVFAVPYVGYVYLALREPLVWLLVLLLPVVAVAVSVRSRTRQDPGRPQQHLQAATTTGDHS